MIPYIVTLVILVFILTQVVKILNEYERRLYFAWEELSLPKVLV